MAASEELTDHKGRPLEGPRPGPRDPAKTADERLDASEEIAVAAVERAERLVTLDAFLEWEMDREGGHRKEVIGAINRRKQQIRRTYARNGSEVAHIQRECRECGKDRVSSKFEFCQIFQLRSIDAAVGGDDRTPCMDFIDSQFTYICSYCKHMYREEG